MIASHTPDEKPQHVPRRTVGLAGLIGAGTACACWPLMLMWVIVGLTLGMPDDAGGMGAPLPVAMGVSSTVVALGAAGILLGTSRLLRRAGSPRPLAVAVVGPLVSVCLFVVVIAGQQNLQSTPAADLGAVLLVPLAGATGFALASRLAPHRAATLALALVSAAAITAAAWWVW